MRFWVGRPLFVLNGSSGCMLRCGPLGESRRPGWERVGLGAKQRGGGKGGGGGGMGGRAGRGPLLNRRQRQNSQARSFENRRLESECTLA